MDIAVQTEMSSKDVEVQFLQNPWKQTLPKKAESEAAENRSKQGCLAQLLHLIGKEASSTCLGKVPDPASPFLRNECRNQPILDNVIPWAAMINILTRAMRVSQQMDPLASDRCLLQAQI